MKKVDVIIAERFISEKEADKLKGKFLTDKDYHTLINDDCDAYDVYGNLLFRFRKNAIPMDVLKNGYESFKKSITLNGGRGIAAGGYFKQVRKDGTLGKFDVSPKVESGNVGFMDARRGSGTVAVCRKTAFAKEYFDEFKQGIPFVEFIDEKYKELCPEHYTKQKAIADGTNRNYVIGDTSFTTVTVNKNFRTAVHKDTGDFKEGFGNLISYREGYYEGSYFCLPEYGIAIDLQNTDILFVDVHKWHGNTETINTSEDWMRISFVMYYREYMYKCGSPTEELERIKMEQTGYLKL
tara:strand:+ start:1248 stop:2132 length:885 start_codon:yes stop_codon:yes gene_type:complete